MSAKQSPASTAPQILEQIQSGRVSMRPHWQFMLLTALSAVGLVAATIVTVFLINLVAYKLRLAEADRPMYGMQSHVSYLTGHFPWLAFVFAAVGLGTLVWLVRRRDISYRVGRWLLGGVVLLSLGIGTGLAYTSLNSHLENYGPMQGMYGQQRRQQGNQQGQQNSTQLQNHAGSGQGDGNMMQNRAGNMK